MLAIRWSELNLIHVSIMQVDFFIVTFRIKLQELAVERSHSNAIRSMYKATLVLAVKLVKLTRDWQ